MMLYSLCLALLFSTIVFGRENPKWMVVVKKSLGNNRDTIRGTGYIVKIGDRYFVRTASHVTLGTDIGVTIVDYKNRPLKIAQNGMITDNSADDQLIEVEGVHFQLATYSKTLNQFVVENPLSQEIQSSKDKVIASTLMNGIYYFSPSFVKRKNSDGFQRTNNYGTSFLNTSSIGAASYSLAGDSFVSPTRVLPGESGSPLIGSIWKLQDQILDLNGNVLDVRDQAGEKVTVVAGHVLRYHLVLKQSYFLNSSSQKLVRSYLDGKRGDVNETIWKYYRGEPYRSKVTKGKVAEEAYFNEPKAGDGSAGHGGDGSAGHGGDGSAGHGGDGSAGHGGDGSNTSKPNIGMIYDSRPVIGFQVKTRNTNESYLVYANWDNLASLERMENVITYDAIDSTASLAKLILSKAESWGKSSSFGFCSISRSELLRDNLVIKLKNYGTVRRSIGAEKLHSFSPVESIELKGGGAISVDYRGLWSIDWQMIPQARNPMDRERVSKLMSVPYIGFSANDDQFAFYECDLVD